MLIDVIVSQHTACRTICLFVTWPTLFCLGLIHQWRRFPNQREANRTKQKLWGMRGVPSAIGCTDKQQHTIFFIPQHTKCPRIYLNQNTNLYWLKLNMIHLIGLFHFMGGEISMNISTVQSRLLVHGVSHGRWRERPVRYTHKELRLLDAQ